VYAAEEQVLGDIGPRLRRWRDVEAFLESVLGDPGYTERFPGASLDVTLERRSRGARASLALPQSGHILIRDGSWNALTVLHELAHLAADSSEPHGPDFVATELELVRAWCGFDAFVALRTAFEKHAVRIGRTPLARAGAPG
jgi:putative metallohydrolase (TIGR04338 family)